MSEESVNVLLEDRNGNEISTTLLDNESLENEEKEGKYYYVSAGDNESITSRIACGQVEIFPTIVEQSSESDEESTRKSEKYQKSSIISALGKVVIPLTSSSSNTLNISNTSEKSKECLERNSINNNSIVDNDDQASFDGRKDKNDSSSQSPVEQKVLKMQSQEWEVHNEQKDKKIKGILNKSQPNNNNKNHQYVFQATNTEGCNKDHKYSTDSKYEVVDFNSESTIIQEDNETKKPESTIRFSDTMKSFSNLQKNDKKEKDEKDIKNSKEPIEIQSSEEYNIPYTNFSKSQLIMIYLIIVYIGFLGPLCGNIYIPALPVIQDAFGVGVTEINGTVAIFMALFAVMPLIWGIYADFGGRKFLYIISLIILACANTLLAAVPANIVALYILRCVQVVGASAAISLGTGTVADISDLKDRGKAIALFMLGPNMGPILAPVFAGLILMNGDDWRWLFGFTAIASGAALVAVLVLLPETLRCIVGNSDPRWSNTPNQYSENADYEENQFQERRCQTPWKLFSHLGPQKPVSDSQEFRNLYPHPPKLSFQSYIKLFFHPPILCASLSISFLFSSYYALSVTLARFLKNNYNYDMLQIGGAYACPGISMILGSQSGGWISDRMRRRWVRCHEGEQYPCEYRLHLQYLGIALCVIGCIGYGWSIEKKYHIALILTFSGILAFGLTLCNNTSMTYLTELFPKRVSGVISVCSFYRNVGAAISSLIAAKLVNAIGAGWAFTYFGLCNVIPFFLIFYVINRKKINERLRL